MNDLEKLEPSDIPCRTVKYCSHFREVWKFLKWLNIELLHDVPVPFLGMHPREMKIYSHKNVCTNDHSNIILNSQKVGKPKFHQLVNK